MPTGQLNILSISFALLLIFAAIIIVSIGYWSYKRGYFMAERLHKITKKESPVFFWILVLLYFGLGIYVFYLALRLAGLI